MCGGSSAPPKQMGFTEQELASLESEVPSTRGKKEQPKPKQAQPKKQKKEKKKPADTLTVKSFSYITLFDEGR